MDRQPMDSDDRWKVSSVDEEKNRAKNRPLWYTADNVNQTRTDITTTDRLVANRKVGAKPRERGEPLTPKETCKRFNKMSWLTVSKAAERSRRARRAVLPRSIESRRSDRILVTADSVEKSALKLDCWGGSSWCSRRKEVSCLATKRSSSLEITDRLEIGR